MDVKALSLALKEEIKHYDSLVDKQEVGLVLSVGDNVAQVYGLDNVMLGEIVIFANNERGLVLNLEQRSVGIAILDDSSKIKENQFVKRTHRVLEVKVGDNLLSRVVDPLGKPLDGKGEIEADTYYPLEKVAPLVMERKSVSEALETGILAIDALTPIGRGQRELIIGDRQTGKSSLAIDTIINQKGKNVKCIYVCIGQKNSTVAHLVDKLNKADALSYTIIVSASASDSAAMQYIAPYAGVAMGEYFMDKGEDVLIVYDDLSKHAVSYRTLSLLLKRSPGREAYPGDVFYLHSRLLERSARLAKGGSITALPIIETQEGDISAYIPTNVISITDGQIFLQTDLFNIGIRPAIDSGLSVSRVGSKAQIEAVKQVSSTLKIDLSNYKELEAFSKFGSDVDQHTKMVLDNGRRVIELLKQNEGVPYSFAEETILLYGVKYNLYKDVKVERMGELKEQLLYMMKVKYKKLVNELTKSKRLDDDLSQKLFVAIKSIIDDFNTRGK